MTLVRWKPRRNPDLFRDFSGIQDEMNRMFELAFRGWPSNGDELLGGAWTPAVDVLEDGDKIMVKAELPGLTDKDIDVSILDDTLTIKGERKHEEEKKEKNYHRIERSYGSFRRSIPLPSSVMGDKVKASFKNGVLEIEMPKKEEAKPRQVKVKVS